MDIICKNNGLIAFEKISNGNVFMTGDGVYFIRIPRIEVDIPATDCSIGLKYINAITLNNGCPEHFDPWDKVMPIDGAFVVGEVSK